MLQPNHLNNLIWLLVFLPTLVHAESEQKFHEFDGLQIMERIYQLHEQYPYVYEEQSIVMVDQRGRRNTRKAKRYSRMDEDGTYRFLFLFDHPETVKGVAILASQTKEGITKQNIYLPALGEKLVGSDNNDGQGKFLGTDFNVESLAGEDINNYQYLRQEDTNIESSVYFVIDVYKKNDEQREKRLKRHFIRQDIFFITRIDYFNRQGNLEKQQSFHDLKPVNGDMWRADMILMQDYKEHHQSLIKINKRVFSHDYVPEEIFTAKWLYEHYPYIPPKDDDYDIEADGMENDPLNTTGANNS